MDNNNKKPFDIKKRCFLFSLGVIDFVKDVKYGDIYFSLFDQLI